MRKNPSISIYLSDKGIDFDQYFENNLEYEKAIVFLDNLYYSKNIYLPKYIDKKIKRNYYLSNDDYRKFSEFMKYIR